MTRGTFICFTGIDGAGKTSISKILVNDLQEAGVNIRYVYNRYAPFMIRPIMLIGKLVFLRKKDFFLNYTEYSNTKKIASKKHPFLTRIYQYLMLCDYFFQIIFKIKLPLYFGKNIVCDRYIYDTIVTDLSVDFNYSEEDVQNCLNKILPLFPTPDIIYLIDVSEEVACQRKDDIPSIEYLKDRRNTYLSIVKECNMKVLNGSMSLNELLYEIRTDLVGKIIWAK